jgi:hypothetical protein
VHYKDAQDGFKDHEDVHSDPDDHYGHDDQIKDESDKKSSSTLEDLKTRLDQGFLRRDATNIRRVFEEFAPEKKLSSRKFRKALLALNSNHAYQSKKKLHKLFETHDLDNSGTLEYEEFSRLLKVPSPVAQWAHTLPLQDMLADLFDFRGDNDAQLQMLSQLTEENILAISQAFQAGICRLLTEQIRKLKDVLFASAKKEEALKTVSEKFSALRYKCGDVKDFHGGLTARVGTKSLLWQLLYMNCSW